MWGIVGKFFSILTTFVRHIFFVKPIFSVGRKGVDVHVKIKQCGMPSCGVSLEIPTTFV